MVVGGDKCGHGKLLSFFIFAGTTFDFCWNQFLDLLQQERIVLGGHDGGGAMSFAARDFCWNQLSMLLQTQRMVVSSPHDLCYINFGLELLLILVGSNI